MESKFEPTLIPGHYYHIYNRGNNGEDIFLETRNYTYFLKLYQKYISPIAKTYAYCLLKNHFHFLVRIKEERNLPGFGNLEGFNPKIHQPFSNFFNAYAKAFNKEFNRHGSLFEKNFKRKLITDENHLLHLVTYIHQNPKRHGLVADFRKWPHSSYLHFFTQKESFLETRQALAWFDSLPNFIVAHQITTNLGKLAEDVFD
jgi:REP element-mobilizing transposase RayT